MGYVYTHINTSDPNDLTLVDESLLKQLWGIRNYGYGKDVRESFARAFERTAIMLSQYKAEVYRNNNQMAELIKEFQNSVGKLTDNAELINARIALDGTIYPTLKDHLDDIESHGSVADYEIGEVEERTIDLVIEGLDDESSPFSYEKISSRPDKEAPKATIIMNATDIGIEPVGGGSNG